MLDIGPSELLLIVIVAVVVIGPKDLPLALRTAGRWIGKMRKVSGHFRTGLDAMVREAEMADMEKKWREQNARIMAEHPAGTPSETEPTGAWPAGTAESRASEPPPPPVDPYADAEHVKPKPAPETAPDLPKGEEGKS